MCLADDLLVPERQEIQGLNLPGTPWATSACRGRPLLYFILLYRELIVIGRGECRNEISIGLRDNVRVHYNFMAGR